MHQANCLNCETALQGGENFCPNCGQKTATHRFTWGHFFHEGWHAFTHTDKGVLSLIKGLATNPGKTVSEYVGGKHKKYFNPITFLLLCLGLMVLVNSFALRSNEIKPDPGKLEQLKTEKEKQAYLNYVNRIKIASNFQQKHPNITAMIFLPFEAFILWLFFRKRGRNYVEFLIATIFISGFGILIYSCILSPFMFLFKETTVYPWLWVLALILLILYNIWGLKGFLTNPEPIAYWKPLSVWMLYFVLMIVFTAVFFLWYVFRENTWLAFKGIIKKLTE